MRNGEGSGRGGAWGKPFCVRAPHNCRRMVATATSHGTPGNEADAGDAAPASRSPLPPIRAIAAASTSEE